MMTRPGLPFDHDLYTHISIRDYHAGMETQADGDWTMYFDPWSVMTVQQAEDGRLFVDDKNGKPVFLWIYPRSRVAGLPRNTATTIRRGMILSGACSTSRLVKR